MVKVFGTDEFKVLIGGDKTGESNKRFYDAFVPLAERIYTDYVAEQAAGEHDE